MPIERKVNPTVCIVVGCERDRRRHKTRRGYVNDSLCAMHHTRKYVRKLVNWDFPCEFGGAVHGIRRPKMSETMKGEPT